MLLQLAALGTLGFVGYKIYGKSKGRHAAYAEGQPEGPGAIRDAGPDAMAGKDDRKWTKVDEESDESFPASDPPANY